MTALSTFETAAAAFELAANTYAADPTAVARVEVGARVYHFLPSNNEFVRCTAIRTGAPQASMDDFLLDVAAYSNETAPDAFLRMGDYTLQMAGGELYQLRHE